MRDFTPRCFISISINHYHYGSLYWHTENTYIYQKSNVHIHTHFIISQLYTRSMWLFFFVLVWWLQVDCTKSGLGRFTGTCQYTFKGPSATISDYYNSMHHTNYCLRIIEPHRKVLAFPAPVIMHRQMPSLKYSGTDSYDLVTYIYIYNHIIYQPLL